MRRDAVLAQGPRSDHELDPEALMHRSGSQVAGFRLESADLEGALFSAACPRAFDSAVAGEKIRHREAAAVVHVYARPNATRNAVIHSVTPPRYTAASTDGLRG